MNTSQILMVYNDNLRSMVVCLYSSGSEARETRTGGSAKQFLSELCLAYGSTMRGRTDACRELLYRSSGIVKRGQKKQLQKTPLYIGDEMRTVFFPTKSPAESDCLWLNWNRISRCYGDPDDPQITRVLFDSGHEVSVACSVRTMKKQMRRCEDYVKILRDREVLPDPDEECE